MVAIDALLNARGSVREIMNLPEGELTWSDCQEWSRLEVLTGLQFSDFRVSQVEVGLNFVSCDFTNCSFQRVNTKGHLGAAGDSWHQCTFEECRLEEMIAPMNSFSACRFESVALRGFRPHQTIFVKTEFSNCQIEGLRAQTVRNRQIVNPAIGQAGGQLIFRDCNFESVDFRRCSFEEVAFENCSFSRVTAQECCFDGVISNSVWWEAQQFDPFTAFLGDVLELVRRKCGPDSAAFREVERYAIDYGCGRNTSRDFSACLYNDRVPYSDTQKIIKDLRNLLASQPF